MKNIECADCGEKVRALTARRKYCGLCQLYHKLVRAPGRKKRCGGCGTLYLQLETTDVMCGECYTLTWPNRGTDGTCRICKQENVKVWDERAKVCPKCLYDPAQRHRVLRACQKAWRRAVDKHREGVV